MSGLTINTNIASHVAIRHYGLAERAAALSLEKLATGSRINRGSDDAAGLISSENLRAVLASLEAESRALTRADSVASVADAALSEVSGILSDAQAAEVAMSNSAGLSEAERGAYQLQIDSARQAVDRIAATTTFAGERILQGGATLTAAGESVEIPRIATGDLSAAVSQVATLRGTIGAFQKDVIGPQARITARAIETNAAAYSMIRDTDYAAETSALTRARVLRGSTIGSLRMANSRAGDVLQLLA